VRPWYELYFGADYWAYATEEYTAERTAAEVGYLAAVLDRAAPGRRVLDVGCGLGRHAIGLAGRGFDVVGVDVSGWAVERAASAASTAGVDVRLHRLDALTAPDSSWPVTEVDAVVCVQAFGWGSDGQQLRMLRTLRRKLTPGGVLVLDHSNVSAILRRYAPHSVASVGGYTFEFLRRYDPLTGRSGGVLRVSRPSGETVELPDDVRLYQPPEVAALLVAAGFEVCRADADFVAGAPVGMDTRYVQFVARVPAWPRSALVGHGPRDGPCDGGGMRAGERTRSGEPSEPGELDLRWAPDEAEYVEEALAAAWHTAGAAGPMRHTARRYDVADPYGARRCTDALAAHFGVELSPERVTAGAGGTGLLHALAGLATGGAVLMDPDGHPELGLAARELGVALRAATLAETETAAAVRAVADARPAVTVLDRPGVTGTVWPVGAVRELAAACVESGGLLVVDETCASYLPAAESAVRLDVPGLVVVRSMSKGYCCGGLRVGFAVSAPDLAGRVRAVCPPLAVSALSLDVAVALLAAGDAALAGLRARIAEAKPRFVALLAGAGVPARAGDPRLPWVTVAAAAADRLAGFGIAGKPVPVAPGRPAVVRLSVPLSEARWRAALAAVDGRR
jgi:histidinol-phosphate/aromatic aminotransferase/cobyric acid decarboxylase-like protein/SAM-dependent methyltransferase